MAFSGYKIVGERINWMIFIFAGIKHRKIAGFLRYVMQIIVQIRNTDAPPKYITHIDKQTLKIVFVNMTEWQRLKDVT